jgi:sortase A
VTVGILRRAVADARAASTSLIAVGTALLLVSAASVARGAIARDAARSRWAEIEAQHAAIGARARASGHPAWTASIGTPVARLIVPKIDLDEVVVEGVGDSELRAGPGHMRETVLPGAAGTSVISAHRDRHFHRLGGLAVGDTLVTESAEGRAIWAVDRVRVVGADARVLRSSPTPKLVLTTCWPIRYFGPAPDRLIIEATKVSSR